MSASAFRDSLDYSIEPSPDGDVLRVQGEVNFITAEKFNGMLQGFVVGGDARPPWTSWA